MTMRSYRLSCRCARLAGCLLVGIAALAGPQSAAAQSTPPAEPQRAWISTIARDHPLVGRLWSPGHGRFIETHLLAREVVREELVILGEVHDNADHHTIRAEIIAAAFGPHAARRSSRPPAIVMEHLRPEQQGLLDRRQHSDWQPTARELMAALDWAKSGWPGESLFLPLFEAVVTAKLPLYAGDPSRERIRAVARGGLASLPAQETARLRLDAAVPDAMAAAQSTELEASHCGLVPGSALGGMADAQRLRDAHLAAVMVSAADRHGAAILLTGNGHARRDRGVPFHLARIAPDRRIVVVELVEVDPARADARGYEERGTDGTPTADFILFTPRAERPDPCEEMRRMMQKKK